MTDRINETTDSCDRSHMMPKRSNACSLMPRYQRLSNITGDGFADNQVFCNIHWWLSQWSFSFVCYTIVTLVTQLFAPLMTV